MVFGPFARPEYEPVLGPIAPEPQPRVHVFRAKNQEATRYYVDIGPHEEPPGMRPLTQKQQDTLDFIWHYVRENGTTPSVRDTMRAMSLSAPSSMQQRIEALRRKGWLVADARCIAVTQQTVDWYTQLEAKREVQV